MITAAQDYIGPAEAQHSRLPAWIIFAALFVVALAVFWPATHCGFLNLDDDDYIWTNQRVLEGLTLDNTIWAFKTVHFFWWHPLTWLSLMLDTTLFGNGPGGYHRTSVFLHALNAALLYLVLYRMTGSLWRSALLAVLFAVHPLRVESVTWLSERKGLLSATFGLLTLLAYARYSRRPGLARYLIVFILFAMSLMAKSMLVTMPLLMLLLDYWPLRRLRTAQADAQDQDSKFPRRSATSLIGEKIPLLALSIASSIITARAQSSAMSWGADIELDDRIANALVSYISYIWKMIWFADLTVLYPHPGSWPLWKVVASCAFLIVVTVFVAIRVRRSPWLAIGWFWFLGTLVPMIGIVQVGAQSIADRYTYFTTIGLLIMLVWSLPKPDDKRMPVWISAFALILIVLIAGTRRQLPYWRDNATLFTRALEVAEENPLVHHNLGAELAARNEINEAIFHFRRALEIDPAQLRTTFSLGKALWAQGDFEEAIARFEQVAAARPDDPAVVSHVAIAYAKRSHNRDYARPDDMARAADWLSRAVQLRPNDLGFRNNYGIALLRLERFDEAIAEFEKAVQLGGDASVQANLQQARKLKADAH